MRVMFRQLSKAPVLTKTEFGGCEIEIAQGVVISTPSVTHLVGLPDQGPPLSFSYPSISAPLLRNVVHNPRQGGGALENLHSSYK